MASAALRLAGLPAPKVVLTLSVEEALYVAAELAGSNTHFHGLEHDDDAWDSIPYVVLVEALRVGADRRGPLSGRYKQHRRVAKACRPEYDNTAGRTAAEREGFLKPEVAAFDAV